MSAERPLASTNLCTSFWCPSTLKHMVMAIQLKNGGASEDRSTSCWKALLTASLLLTLLFLGFFSKPLLFDHDGIHYSTDVVKKLHSQDVLHVATQDDRPLILYAYAHSDNALINLKFFLGRALHAHADFIFIFNGNAAAAELVPVHLENVRVVKRPNTCYDLGAFGEVLAQDNLWMRYKRFITLNASIRGPFLPMWSDDCWTDAFLNRITDDIKVKNSFGTAAIMANLRSSRLTFSLLYSSWASRTRACQVHMYSRCSLPQTKKACEFSWTRLWRSRYL